MGAEVLSEAPPWAQVCTESEDFFYPILPLKGILSDKPGDVDVPRMCWPKLFLLPEGGRGHGEAVFESSVLVIAPPVWRTDF